VGRTINLVGYFYLTSALQTYRYQVPLTGVGHLGSPANNLGISTCCGFLGSEKDIFTHSRRIRARTTVLLAIAYISHRINATKYSANTSPGWLACYLASLAGLSNTIHHHANVYIFTSPPEEQGAGLYSVCVLACRPPSKINNPFGYV
jgi:hypothetical protein